MGEETETARPDTSADVKARPGDNNPKGLTEEQIRRRREWLASDWAMIAFALLVIYLAVGNGWTARKEGASFAGAAWAFLKSYLGIALSIGVVLGLLGVTIEGVREALKAWGGYLLALVLGPIALWYWAGSYHAWRDIAIFVGVTVVLLRAQKFVNDLIARSIARLGMWCAKLQGSCRTSPRPSPSCAGRNHIGTAPVTAVPRPRTARASFRQRPLPFSIFRPCS